MIEALKRAFTIPELKNRLFFVLMMFFVYAIGAHIPVPGIDHKKIEMMFGGQGKGGVLGLLDVFSGGSLRRMSIFGMTIGPYINASIIMQMMSFAVPQLEAMSKEGESGRKQIAKITRYLTIVLGIFQSFGMTLVFAQNAIPITFWNQILICVTLTAGTMFLLWMGEQITQKGVGNGVSLIIFAGILLSLPYQFGAMFLQIRSGTVSYFNFFVLIAAFVAMIYGVVYLTQGVRRIPTQHTKRVIGMRQTQAGGSFLPIKVNMAGVIPIIFAISLMLLPTTLISALPFKGPFFDWLKNISQYCNPGNIPHFVIFGVSVPIPIAMIFYFLLVVVFTFLYTSITMNVPEIAENLNKYGSYIPGIRQGKPTKDYLEKVVSRITLAGAFFLGIIAISQYVMPSITGFNQSAFPLIGGTSLLIVVGVAIETMQAVEAQLLMRNYEGFIKDNPKPKA